MKKLKRLFCVLLALPVILAFSAAAETAEPSLATFEIEIPQYLSGTRPVTIPAGLEHTVLNGWDGLIADINVSAYSLSVDNFSCVIHRILLRNPEFFFISNRLSGAYDPRTRIVKYLHPEYINIDKIPYQRAEFRSAADRIIAKMPAGLSEENRIIFLHDFLVSSVEYDPDGVAVDVNAVDFYSFRAFGALVNNVAVCEGYAKAFVYLAGRAGLYTSVVTSDPMVHAWNLARVGSYHFHLDPTWNDTAAARFNNVINLNGFMVRDFFLRSDTQFAKPLGYHHDWVSAHAATNSTAFTDAFWHGVNSNIFFIRGLQFFVRDGRIYERHIGTGAQNRIHTFAAGTFLASNGQTYIFPTSFTTIAHNYENNFLLFNTHSGVYAFNTSTRAVTRVIYAPARGFIAGIAFVNGQLRVDFADVVAGNTPIITRQNYVADFNWPTYLVTQEDVVTFQKYLAGEITTIYLPYFDVNKDGRLDLKDLHLMKRYLGGFVQTLR